MSTARPQERPADATPPRLRAALTVSVIALCGLGTLAISGGGGYRDTFGQAFAVAALLRLVLGREGAALLPRRLLLVLGYTATAVSMAYLFRSLGARGGGSLWALMCVTSVFQALVLLWRQSTFSSFLLILLSSVHAAGIPFAHADAWGLVFVTGYVTLLVWTLVLFERRASLEGSAESSHSVEHVRAGVEATLAPVLRTSLVLVLLGLPLGTALYLAAPRNLQFGSLPRAAETEDGAGLGAEAGAPRLREETGPGRTEFAFAGPGGDGAPLGSVAEIKRNFEPWFEVALVGRTRLPPTVILRDNARDHYLTRGVWKDTISEEGRARLYRDVDDGRRDGRIPLGTPDRDDGVTLEIEMLRGGPSRLYLQPDPVSLHIVRAGRALTAVTVGETLNQEFSASRPLEKGDVIVQRYVPPLHEDQDLVGRRSDPAVAPLTSFLQVPAPCRAPLRAAALRAVGSETDPWRRARRLEAWLKSDAFTYSLRIPPLDRANPIVDFVQNTRTANCEAFAYALTLMLRTLGHPARYVRGFWGGDLQEERKTVVLRGLHYHAWSEMYLQGAGWVPLNPTPPDRRPVDAQTQTAAKEAWEARAAGEDDADWSFLGYDDAGWRALWGDVGRWLDRWILAPVGVLFSRRTGWLGVPLLFLLVWLLRLRSEHVRALRLAVPRGRRLPPGAYGRALLLLARKGIRRRPNQTAREYVRHLGLRLPAAVGPMARLTRIHEARRYGGREPARERETARRELAALRQALRPRAPG